MADPSLDRLGFAKLVKILAVPLAKQGYQPGREMGGIDQLLVVHWGRTVGWDSHGYGDAYGSLNRTFDTMKSAFPDLSPYSSGPTLPGVPQASARTLGVGGAPGAAGELENMLLMLALQEDARNRMNGRTARLLGYQSTIAHLPVFFGSMVCMDRADLIDEIEDDRYYVVLAAYDFPATLKNRQPKILWITRFSLQTHGNEFDRSIDRMVQAAAAYFGRSSDGLRRERLSGGSAVSGELKVINYEEPGK
jgi:hypothetical protein